MPLTHPRNQGLDVKSHRRIPVWEIQDEFKLELRGRERVAIELLCPYPDCTMGFIVEKRKWFAPIDDRHVLTRPCPHCFRVSYIPTAEAEAHKRNWEVSL